MATRNTRNTIHVRETSNDRYDIEIFPLGTVDTVVRTDLTPEQVADLILSAPGIIDILSIDRAGKIVNWHDAVRAELRTRGHDFVGNKPCSQCGSTGLMNGAPCPACSVPWRGSPPSQS